jgi:pyrroloquinoline quinone biosynthesis protein B
MGLPDFFVVVLGIAQDAGYPQAGCEKECCAVYWKGKEDKKLVTSLALVDREAGKYWLIEATPDIGLQLKNLQQYLPAAPDYSPDGIFISHAHTGHYTGLMEFGREAMGAKNIPVYAMPRLDTFLRSNGPWSQLVGLANIRLQTMQEDSAVRLSASLSVIPVRVPHRDEYSETVGFRVIHGPRILLFIPDLDKWELWSKNSTEYLKEYDYILIDGTFYKNGELPGRDMREVPHPFVEESVRLFSVLPDSVKAKIHFIHFNHTNPLLKKKSDDKDRVKAAGFGVAEEGMIITL